MGLELSPKLTLNQNFFCGGRGVAVRKMQNMVSGSCKTSDFFGQKYGCFTSKVRMFASKKSDVFVFRKRGEVLNTDYPRPALILDNKRHPLQTQTDGRKLLLDGDCQTHVHPEGHNDGGCECSWREGLPPAMQ